MNTIYINIAISGAGKSYYLKNKFLLDFPEVSALLTKENITLSTLIVEPDGIRREVTGDVSNITQDAYIWKLVRERLYSTIKTYGTAILDATNVSDKTRKNSIKNCDLARKVALVFPANVELSKERITNDIKNGVDRSKVPMLVVDRQFESYKKGVVGDELWNGIWNDKTKALITLKLKDEFDEIRFIEY